MRSSREPLPERVGELVSKLRRIPDGARTFDVTMDYALSRFRIPAAVLATAVAHGLPYRGEGDGRRLDLSDLINVALHLGTGAAAHTLRDFLPRALAATAGRAPRYRVSYLPSCPAPGHGPVCEYLVTVPGRQIVTRVPAADPGPVFEADLSIEGEFPDLPPEAVALLDEFSALDFVILPPAVNRDVDFIRHSGLADCQGFAQLLLDECRRRGLSARRSYGFLLSPPFVNRHHWAELAVDGAWLPVEPVLLGTMLRWGVLDPGRWTPHRTLGPVLWRIAGDVVPLLTHDGSPVPASFSSRLLPAAQAPADAGARPAGNDRLAP